MWEAIGNDNEVKAGISNAHEPPMSPTCHEPNLFEPIW
jgi:hypothetical protein